MPTGPVETFLAALRDATLLPAEQLNEVAETLRTQFADPDALAQDLVRRGWLTQYQADELLRGQGGDLVLGDYTLLERLDPGGMGQVFKARHRATAQVMALKLVRGDLLANPEIVRRFRRETQAVLRLSHPHVVTALGAAEAGNRHFLVMEYIEGSDLRRLVQGHGPLPVEHACEWALQAARGLQHFLECGLVHRDIKPSNLVWDSRQSVLKILDLGLARLISDAEGQTSLSELTQTGAVMGTPDFMAPEQAQDARAVDIRADLYSLGCTLYYLLTGRVPFPGGSLIQKLDRHRWSEPEPVEQLRAEVSSDVQAVVRTLMAKRPDDRYRTPAEAARALEAITLAGRFFFVGECRRWEGHTGRVCAVAFSPDGRRAASGAEDRTVRVWDVADGREIHRLEGHGHTVLRVTWVASDRVLSCGSDLDVRLWDADHGRQLGSFFRGGREIDGPAFGPDGRTVLAAMGDKSFCLWDVESGQVLRRFEGHAATVWEVTLSPDSRQALSVSKDQTMRLWDTATGQELCRLEGHRGPVFCAAFSPDGRLALSGGWDRTVRLWELGSGHQLRCFPGHQLNVRSVAFSCDGGRALSASNDATLRLWDVAAGQELACFRGHHEQVLSVAFSPDGRCALSGGADSTVRLWRLPGELRPHSA
jgi:hypothetical protein